MNDEPRVPDNVDQPDDEGVLHAPGIDIETTEARYDRLRGDRKRPPKLRAIDILVLLLLLVATAFTRFWRLGEPGRVLPATDPACTAAPPINGTCYEPIPT